jgi:hypothetical protein
MPTTKFKAEELGIRTTSSNMVKHILKDISSEFGLHDFVGIASDA